MKTQKEKMSRATLKALNGSIKKWEAIVAGTGRDLGSHNCPLCEKFMFKSGEEFEYGCYGCPVSQKTGLGGCDGTPYTRWIHVTFGRDKKAVTKEQKDAAKKMLMFLKRLVPKENRK